MLALFLAPLAAPAAAVTTTFGVTSTGSDSAAGTASPNATAWQRSLNHTTPLPRNGVADARAAWVPPSAAAVALQAAITHAIEEEATTHEKPTATVVTAPSGDVYFNSASLNITGAHHVTLRGATAAASTTAPTTLYFAPGVGVKIENSSDIVVDTLSIDYHPLPYVFGSVKATTSHNTTVVLDPRSLTFETFVAQYPPHDTWPPITAFDKQSADRKKGLCSWGQAPAATRIASREYVLACNGDGLAPGDLVVAATRVGYTLALSYTARVVVRNIVIYAAGNMAITEFQGEGGNAYENVSLIPRDASRPLSSNADGFHSSGMAHGPVLRRVTMRNLLDDYFNVHNTVQLVAAVHTETRSLLVGDYQLFAGTNLEYATQRTLGRVAIGDRVSFFPINTFTWPALASGVVASIAAVHDPALQHVLTDTYSAASRIALKTPCSACRAGLNPHASAQLWNITLSETLPSAIAALTFLNADAISNTGAVVEDCDFSGSNSNLGRWKSSGGTITNSRFSQTVNANLEISPLQNWLEGPLGIHNVTVSDNTFVGMATSPVHTFGAVGIHQFNNTFVPKAA